MRGSRSTVGIAPGDGLVARFGGVVVYLAGETASTDRILGAVEAVAEAEHAGAAIAQRLAAVVFGPGSEPPPFGVVAPTADGTLILLRGPVVAVVEGAEGARRLDGTRAFTWVDEIIREPVRRITVGPSTAAPLRERPRTNLQAGIVPGNGFVLHAAVRRTAKPVAASRPAPADAAEPPPTAAAGFAAPEPTGGEGFDAVPDHARTTERFGRSASGQSRPGTTAHSGDAGQTSGTPGQLRPGTTAQSNDIGTAPGQRWPGTSGQFGGTGHTGAAARFGTAQDPANERAPQHTSGTADSAASLSDASGADDEPTFRVTSATTGGGVPGSGPLPSAATERTVLDQPLHQPQPSVLDQSLHEPQPTVLNQSLHEPQPTVLNQSLPEPQPTVLDQALPEPQRSVLDQPFSELQPTVLNQPRPGAQSPGSRILPPPNQPDLRPLAWGRRPTAAPRTVAPNPMEPIPLHQLPLPAEGPTRFMRPAAPDAAPGSLVLHDGTTYPLDRPYVIGRAPQSDEAVRTAAASPIVLPRDRHISRAHAYLTVDQGKVFVRDADTRSGTFISAPDTDQWTRIGTDPVELPPTWRVRISQRILTFRPEPLPT